MKVIGSSMYLISCIIIFLPCQIFSLTSQFLYHNGKHKFKLKSINKEDVNSNNKKFATWNAKLPKQKSPIILYNHENKAGNENQSINHDLIKTLEIPITEVDMRYNLRTPLVYNPTVNRYMNVPSTNKNRISAIFSLSYLSHFFIPSSVTPSYYTYIRWRILQRFINAIVHVLGTQSLLMGLGLKSSKVGFASASLTWVCKDALGKIARMIWASKMGQKFDSDAKRWRFRSSLVFALGNGLEICALAFPKFFLLWATLSNAMKQMSMLTSSATRNALYNSFSASSDVRKSSIKNNKNDDIKSPENDLQRNDQALDDKVRITGVPSSSKKIATQLQTITENNTTAVSNSNARIKREAEGGGANIGDITAKGEAQIAVVDLLGIAFGICLSKIIGVRVRNVLFTWLFLQICEIACMYKEIRSVVFSVLNFERLWYIVEKFVDMNLEEENNFNELFSSDSSSKKNSNLVSCTAKATPEMQGYQIENVSDYNSQSKKQRRKVVSFYSAEEKYKREFIPTPMQMAHAEKIFLPPEPLARRSNCFGSFGRTSLNPIELKSVINIFKGEKFLLFVGDNTKRRTKKNKDPHFSKDESEIHGSTSDPREHCHVVLHKDATNMDIVKSTLALGILRQCLSHQNQLELDNYKKGKSNKYTFKDQIRTQDFLPMLELAKVNADEWFPRFLKTLQSRGWATPARYMFGKVTMRADWPIAASGNGKVRSKTPNNILNEGNDVLGAKIDINTTQSEAVNGVEKKQVLPRVK